MVFSGQVFLTLFLPTSIITYFLARKIGGSKLRMANIWLIIISLFFYAWGEPIFVFLMLLSIIINFILGKRLVNYSKTKEGKKIVAVAVTYNLGVLFVFKYLSWVLGLITPEYSGIFSILDLPIGISFYTFQSLSFIVDVYRGGILQRGYKIC